MESINWLGLWTLYEREVTRYMKVWNQTLVAPIVTTLLFLAILVLAMGGNTRHVEGLNFNEFLAPGLIMMAVVQNAFANTSSSLMLMKIQGVIVDLLMPPLTGSEITFSMVAGGVTRGVMVGVVVALALRCFVPYDLQHPLLALYYLISASTLLALLGMLTGIRAQTFDQQAAITNYIITPLSFLSGTFYSVRNLPPFFHTLSHLNPFFYMIDGFRYALTGYHDGNVAAGALAMLACNVLLWTLTMTLINRGYRLRT
jgi:ABC-2 type transport system permease protein